MIHLYSSNRLEWLAEKLAESTENEAVFASETVIVQSRGMERWIKLQIAANTGICANITCPFPKSFIVDCLKKSTGLPQGDLFSKDLLRWRIYEFLRSKPTDAAFSIPVNYLSGTNKKTKTYQLANRVANLYDEYQTFRPNSILSWSGFAGHPFAEPVFETSEHEGWQRRLWQELNKDVEETTFLAQLLEFMALDLKTQTLDLPKRIHLFGISALPPIFMSFFDKLATVVDLGIFYLTPCQEFWEDCVKEDYKLKQEMLSEEETYWETGNPLLSSMGILGRDFSRLINGLVNVEGEHSTFFDETWQTISHNHLHPPEQTLLQHLQNDMLTLDNPLQASNKYVLHDEDTSMGIHVCHSPMREIEILYDQLLAALNKDSSLSARDILVMTPDVAIYAPYIKAVFDNPEEDRLRIPYSIADKTPGQDNPLAGAFLAILNLANTRFTALDVLEIFEVEAVRQAFRLSGDDLTLIRRWVQESGICWGTDGKFKEGLGLPNTPHNTWAFGFDRLMMGYAMPESEGIIGDILPLDIEGSDAELLGRFMGFWAELKQVAQQQAQSSERSIEQWESFLGEVIDSFFEESPQSSDDLREVWFAVNRLIQNLNDSGVECPISWEAVLAELETIFNDDTAGTGFLHGGVTFCRLRPMRSIPARMICLIGMNEGEFPRQSKGLGFDLMSSKRYSGDRNSRLDDRYLFLESLISAREKFYISYIGRSIKDNSIMPPSILVSELVDYIEQSTERIGQNNTETLPCRDLLCIEHPLQAFNARYFDQSHPDLVSFSAANSRGAAAVSSASDKKGAISTNQVELAGKGKGIALAEDAQGTSNLCHEKIEIPLNNLIRFFEHPTKYYIRDILNTRLGRQEVLKPEVDEPFVWNPSDFFRNTGMINDLIAQKNSIDPESCYETFRSAGEMPQGKLGKKQFLEHFATLQDFSTEIIELYGKQSASPAVISIDLGDSIVNGTIPNLLPQMGILNYRYAKTREKLYLRTWIEGLCLNSQESSRIPATTACLDRNGRVSVEAFRFPEAATCRKLLKALVALYVIGTEAPLPFFPKTSMAFVKKVELNHDALDEPELLYSGIEAATKKWLPGYNFPGECGDTYNHTAFGESWFQEASTEEIRLFGSTALSVFGPLLQSMEQAGGEK